MSRLAEWLAGDCPRRKRLGHGRLAYLQRRTCSTFEHLDEGSQ